MGIKTKILSLITAVALVIAGITIPAIAKDLDDLYQENADYGAKIEAKKAEIAALEGELARISGEVASYQQAISVINYEIQILNDRIDLTQAEYDELQAQIERLELEIENNKDALGLTLRELYHTKNISLIERLATSQSLSSFIDREAQLDNISSELTSTVAAIESDKADLEVKQNAAEQKLADLAAQKSEQNSKKQQQQTLLGYSQQQQSEYSSKKRTADTEREQLEAAQRNILRQIALATGAGDPTKGGYKYAASCPTFGPVDPWGMYICQCVSYTAYKVHEQYVAGQARYDMPYWGGRGNAKLWYNNAGDDGIPRGKTPKVGSVGVITSGEYGHVVWVEAIGTGTRSGQIYVSEYNYSRPRDYSESWYNISSFVGFVYFNER